MKHNFMREAFGIEDLEVDPALLNPENGEVGDADDIVEAIGEQEEMSVIESDMQELEGDIDNAEDAVDALEEVIELIEEKQEDGGMDEEDAKVVAVATEAILTIAFKGAVEITFPSVESFGQANGRAIANAYSLETLKETVEKIWNGIKNMVKTFIAKVKNFFGLNSVAAYRAGKIATAMGTKANSIYKEGGENAKGGKDLALKAAEIRYTTDAGEEFNGGVLISRLTEMTRHFATQVDVKNGEEQMTLATKLLETIDLSTVEKAKESIGTPDDGGLIKEFERANVEIDDKRWSGEGVVVFVSDNKPLGNYDRFTIVQTADEGKTIKGFKIIWAETEPSVKYEDKTVKSLDAQESTKVCVAVAKLAKNIGDAKASAEKIVASGDAGLAKGDAAIKKIKSAPKDVQELPELQAYKTRLNLIGQIIRSNAGSVAQQRGHYLKVCNASLSVVKKSMSANAPEKKKEEKAA